MRNFVGLKDVVDYLLVQPIPEDEGRSGRDTVVFAGIGLDHWDDDVKVEWNLCGFDEFARRLGEPNRGHRV